MVAGSQNCRRRVASCWPLAVSPLSFLLSLAFAGSAGAQIYNYVYDGTYHANQVIPGTEAITPGPGVNLSGWNTPGHQLEFAFLISTNLTGASFANSDLTSADFYLSTLLNANFKGAIVTGAYFGHSDFTAAQLISTASYANGNLSGMGLQALTLSGVNFANKNLTNAGFYLSNLTNTNFTGAMVKGTYLGFTSGFTSLQLYSTASYTSGDLTGIRLPGDSLTGWNFTNKNLTSADFYQANLSSANLASANLTGASFEQATLTSANFTAADLRGASFWFPAVDTVTHNTIRPNGSIRGLALLAGEKLVVRNNSTPISVTQSSAFDPASTVQFLLDGGWTSPIGFSPGLAVTLSGTLDLELVAGANPASQLGNTFELFNWTGAQPTGSFTVSSPYTWDLSNLYSTGNITLVAVPEPPGLVMAGLGILVLSFKWWRKSVIRFPLNSH